MSAPLQPQPRAVPQQAQIVLQFVAVAGYVMNFAALIGIDFSQYEQGKDGRFAILHLAHGHQHIFEDKRADELYVWYLQTTGQNRIEQAAGPLADRHA